MEIIDKIRNAINNNRRFWRIHASEKLIQLGIPRKAIYNIILNGDVIENYPGDYYNPSCLIYGKYNDEPVHVVCACSEDSIAIIVTIYKPDPTHFESDNKTRRKK